MFKITRLVVAGAMSLLVTACTSPNHPTPIPPLTITPPLTVPPSAPTPPPASTLLVFSEPATGFSTSDVYDAHDRIVQFTKAGDLVWTPDGTHLQGYFGGADPYYGPPTYFISRPLKYGKCDEFCVFSVRFGEHDGQRRAYLTIDYGHDNPGTLVDVEVSGGVLVVTQTSLFPPGTPTLSGVVTELTPAGRVPVVGASVYRGVPAGWQGAVTDQNGFYELRGLITGTDKVEVLMPGYQKDSRDVTLDGDTRLDLELVRQ